MTQQRFIKTFLLSFLCAALMAQSDFVGVNTNNPQAQLHVQGDSVILESGQFGSQLIFSMEEFEHVMRSLQNISIAVDTGQKIMINPEGANRKLIVGDTVGSDNAVFTVSADNKGIMIPRLDQDSINAMTMGMNDEGLLVYNTSNSEFNVFDGAGWQALSTGGASLWTENGSGEAYRMGNIGVNTNDPAATLDVDGNLIFRGDRLDFRASNGSTFNQFGIVKGGSHYYIGNNMNDGDLFISADKDIRFRTDNAGLDTRMTLKRNGFLGINTDTPQGHFEVKGNIFVNNENSSGAILFNEGIGLDALIAQNNGDFQLLNLESNGDIILQTPDQLRFFTNGNTSLFDSNGNLGLGNETPLERLDVAGAIKLGSTATNNDGSIKYESNDFQGYNGTSWLSLTDKDDADADPTNEIQVLTDESDPGSTVQVGIAVSGQPVQDINITNAITSLPGYGDDADADPLNEIQQLGLNGNILSLTNGGGTVTIPSSGGGGGSLWTDNSGDIYYNAGMVGIGTTTPSSDLHVIGDGTAIETVDFNTGDLTGSSDLLNLTVGANSVDGAQIIEANRGGSNVFRVNANGDTYVSGDLGVGFDDPQSNLDVLSSFGVRSQTRQWGGLTGSTSPGQPGDIRTGRLYLDDGSSTADFPSFEVVATYDGTFNPNHGTVLSLRPPGNTSNTGVSMGITKTIGDEQSYITVYNTAQNQQAVVIKENIGGEIELYDDNTRTIKIDGQSQNGTAMSGSAITLYDYDSNEKVRFRGLEDSGWIGLKNANDHTSIELDGQADGSGATVTLNRIDGNSGIELMASETTGQGAAIKVFNSLNEVVIELDADHSGNGRVITEEVEITGGSDFAEHFDILEDESLRPIPGMVVSIDANSTGKLTISTDANDKKVAGIISGANGVKTGLMMGQSGSIADGDHPVALSGRVYVYANSEGGEIVPGDFLTTSSRAGYAMKVQDFQQSQGAIIGKAMTRIDEKGFVLVLVNLQ